MQDIYILIRGWKIFDNVTHLQIHITATVRKPSHVDVDKIVDCGRYISNCLTKYVQQIQLTAGDELEVLIVPEGIVPTLAFLKDHHNTQFTNLTDITALDVPSRQYRFEVIFWICVCMCDIN